MITTPRTQSPSSQQALVAREGAGEAAVALRQKGASTIEPGDRETGQAPLVPTLGVAWRVE